MTLPPRNISSYWNSEERERWAKVRDKGITEGKFQKNATLSAIEQLEEQAGHPPTPPAEPQPGIVLPPGYKLIWQDEFDGNALDLSKWNVRDNDTYGSGNNEEQRYFARNVQVGGGFLSLTAKMESTGGPGDKLYTSGFITTRALNPLPQRFAFTHGYIECLIRTTPISGGLWPAAWLVGDKDTPVGNPAYGEFDIMEGYGTYPNSVECTSHWTDATKTNKQQSKRYTLQGGDQSMFHAYGCLWTPNYVSYYIDGKLVDQWSATDSGAFLARGYGHTLNLNLAVGGNGPRKYHGWDGTWPDGGLPARMDVGYVRVWQP